MPQEPMPQERYTHGHHESVLRSHGTRTANNSAAYLVPHLRSGQRLLDVGCGPATITADLARLVAPGAVIGVDNSEQVLRIARTTLDDMDLAGVELYSADVYALPFADATFDVVHAHQVLQHLIDPVAALVEMRRVCRPGGLVAARDADYPAMAWYPTDPVLDAWMTLYLDVARANGAEPAAGRRIAAWARAADFSAVTASASVWCYATQAERDWWGGLWAERITSSAVANQALQLGLTDQEGLEDIARAWKTWAASDDGWFAVMHGEVLCRVGESAPPAKRDPE